MPDWLSALFANPSLLVAIITVIGLLLPAGSPLRLILEKLKVLFPQEDKIIAKLHDAIPSQKSSVINTLLDETLALWQDGKKNEAELFLDTAAKLNKRES